MRGLIRWFLDNPVATNLLLMAIVAAGIASALSTTIRTFPEIATRAVTVTVAYPGATPTEISDAILVPIEERLQGLEGVRKLTGTAQPNLGTVTAELTSGANMSTVKDDIETEVGRISTFPTEAEQPRISEVDPTELAVQFAIWGDVPQTTLKALAERARDDLTALPEISQVSISGVPVDLIEVTVDRDTLRAYGMGLTDLGQRLASETLSLSAGTIDTGDSDIQVRTVGEAESPDTLRDKILFTSDAGGTVKLGEIARIRDILADTNVSATISGKSAVFVSVNRAGSEQVLTVADAATRYLDQELMPNLPPAVEAAVWRDEADSLRGRINLLAKNGAIGAALIVLILMMFLDLRVAGWVAAGVVISFIGAFIPMAIFGSTINQLSLFGFILALGIVVDDAIVVGEETYGELEGDGDPEGASRRAIMRVWRPIVFSVTTTILAFTPLLFLPGSSGSFISPVAAVVIFILFMSLIECFFILPRHLQTVRMREPRKYSPRRLTEAMRRWVDRGFRKFREGPLRRLVRGSVNHPVFTVVVCVALGVATAGLLAGGVVRVVFFPAIEGNFVTAELNLPDGTSATETLLRAQEFIDAASAAAEQVASAELLQNTSVSIGFASAGGGGGGGTSVNPGSTARIEAKLADASSRDVSSEAFKNAWREAVGEVPGAREVIFSSSILGVGAPVVIQVAAETEEVRDAATARLREALAARSGVFDIRDDRVSAAQEIAISLKPAARVYDVSLEGLANEIRAAFYGFTVDQFARNQEEVDIRLRLVDDQRDSVADLLALQIPTGPEAETPGLVPISILADLSFRPAPTSITRLNGQSITTLQADVDNAVTTGGAETSYLMSEIVPGLEDDYPDLRVTTGGEQEEAGRFGSALALNFGLTLLAIYGTLALAFGSYARPFIVLGVIPFGFFGAVIGHAALGLNVTLLSMFGIIGLSGVIVNAALLIVDFIQSNEAEGMDPFDAIVEATLSRFRPVILTTLTTFFGIAPLILEPSVQAQFLIPTAVALGFGVLFASLIQMVIVPAYASLYAMGRRRIQGRAQQPARA
ncbi:efflux RND transporter permease subunit [Palleronia sediminis]|uniref:Efflux RND transporter permease subunit n=1 Tax=Palleronia sediminis TaxID=2547833 RepID=A0A4R6AAB1_9RHOB|nr:efflux RND transporter permease subunit [Palleronia sediminis]TDL78196.1 efflux RND transporter permease subunit [Palleronia sediminis]